MAAVTTSAPLEPKIVNCSSTPMPPGGDGPPERPESGERRRPGPSQPTEALAEEHALRSAHGQAGDGPLDDKVAEAGPVADGGRTDGEADHEAERRADDPALGGHTAPSHAPRLDGAEDDAGDGAAEEGGGEPVDPPKTR